jgi:hypothetical protein
VRITALLGKAATKVQTTNAPAGEVRTTLDRGGNSYAKYSAAKLYWGIRTRSKPVSAEAEAIKNAFNPALSRGSFMPSIC